MTIVVHASDCKAIQCKPIDKQSALMVATRPAQRNMTARLITTLFDVNRRRNARDTSISPPVFRLHFSKHFARKKANDLFVMLRRQL